MRKQNHRNYKNTFSNSVKWHRELRISVYQRDSFVCQDCGYTPDEIPQNYDGKFTVGNLVLDHITPVIKGGTLGNLNLRTLCDPCNARKGSTDSKVSN